MSTLRLGHIVGVPLHLARLRSAQLKAMPSIQGGKQIDAVNFRHIQQQNIEGMGVAKVRALVGLLGGASLLLFKTLVIDMKFSILALITVVSVLSTRDAAGAPLPALMIRETEQSRSRGSLECQWTTNDE
ncbi:hypothetical protein PIIN_11170 [Serendipita indica DSM 11827]|uniref:Uncharacterized protein n=1 Tax=Serendipita indica (strain DSM 11827) TaxID=1109443 RepID=G4U0U5_SERID|nr:hypothetical protein PIIN_11170 [Serendipita indica DSM 11827]